MGQVERQRILPTQPGMPGQGTLRDGLALPESPTEQRLREVGQWPGVQLHVQQGPEPMSLSLLCALPGEWGGKEGSPTWRSEMSIFSRILNFWPMSRSLGTQ